MDAKEEDNESSFPLDLFDTNYYAERYADVRSSGIDPYTHFRKWGEKEGRTPSPAFELIARALVARSRISSTPFEDIVGLFPRERCASLAQPEIWLKLKDFIQPEFYCSQLEGDPLEGVDACFDHFLGGGAFDGLRVSLFFSSDWYREVAMRAGLDIGGADPFFHWLSLGRELELVPTPLFDAEHYLAAHPDLSKWRGWAFDHFITHGCYESARWPTSRLERPTSYGGHKRSDKVVLVSQVLSGLDEEGRPPQIAELKQCTQLEKKACDVECKTAFLREALARELVAKAAELEPLVMRPYGAQEIMVPPVKHPAKTMVDAAKAMRSALDATHYDTIVLAPHCRMAGSARVTGALTTALKILNPDKSVLVVTTDLADFERTDWFHPEVRVFDMSVHTLNLGPDHRIRLLLDLVRGLAPSNIINVNSRLAWDLFRSYGKQLSRLSRLSSYLFTWDLDRNGNKGGYPITYFQSCFGHLSRVVVDNSALRDELVARYSMSRKLRDRIVVAYTPVDVPKTDYSKVYETRRNNGRKLRAIWAGRFDRQKRFDLVVEIARRMPELEIWAWGKPVLGGLVVDFSSLPNNIKLLGVYRNFDDLPLEASDFFLYTSEWDGLPTVLLDAGARGMATIASAVGGVADLLTEETGYPVADALDPDAYVAAINRMSADPSEVRRRAAALRYRVTSMCGEYSYLRTIGSVIGEDN